MLSGPILWRHFHRGYCEQIRVDEYQHVWLCILVIRLNAYTVVGRFAAAEERAHLLGLYRNCVIIRVFLCVICQSLPVIIIIIINTVLGHELERTR